MGKRERSQKKENRNIKRGTHDEDVASEDMDDEIDTFIKQRDVVPLDMNDDHAESDEDDEQPVFDLEGIYDEDDNDDDFTNDSGLAAKIVRQQKFLRDKFGGAEDEMYEDEDEDQDEEQQNAIWGPKKSRYYDADNRDYELQSSDDESLAEEEEAVLQLQRQKAQTMSLEDFGLQDVSEDESDRKLTLEEIYVEKRMKNSLVRKEALDNTDTNIAFEKIEKDLNSLSREEQMEVLYSSAPELVGLLSELNDSLAELESKIHPLISKVENCDLMTKGGLRYLKTKQVILLSYCQAITFYLLLKSEGQPIRDHPVIARLVEIKSLLDKMKQLDQNLPTDFEEILNKIEGAHEKLTEENVPESLNIDHEQLVVSSDPLEAALPHDKDQLVTAETYKGKRNKSVEPKKQDDQVGVQSIEMLKVRAALEEKLKKTGIFNSGPKLIKAKKHLHQINGKLDTYDDFDDDTSDHIKGATTNTNTRISDKLSRLATANLNKTKVVSGDDDLPERDNIGERRRKYELQGLGRATIKSDDFDNGVEENDEAEGSEDEFYKQIKEQRAAKLAAKAEIYSRSSAVPPLTETVDGKRNITYQMEKNRGLTRSRKKLMKNPRKKYKLKYKGAENRRKGQVREVKKPTHMYGGEASGINAGISRSVRFKN